MRKINIQEKSLRKIVRDILLENTVADATAAVSATGSAATGAAGTGIGSGVTVTPVDSVSSVASGVQATQDALKELKKYYEVDVAEKIYSEFDILDSLKFFMLHEASTPHFKLIKEFGSALHAYVKAGTGEDPASDPSTISGNNVYELMRSIFKVLKGDIVRNKIGLKELTKDGGILNKIYTATEGGLFGLGTEKGSIQTQLESAIFKNSIEMFEINKTYRPYTKGKANVVRAGATDKDMYELFMEEFDGGLEVNNVRTYIINPLLSKVFCVGAIGDSKEEVELKLEDMFKTLTDKAVEIVEGTESEESADEEQLSIDIDSGEEGEEGEEIDGVEPPGDERERDSLEREESSGNTAAKIKGEIVREVIPKRIPGDTPKFEDIFDVREFQRSIVAGMREDRRSFASGQNFELEVSFTEDATIDRVFAGTHRIVIGGSFLRKAKKSRKWDGNIKKIFADALDNAMSRKRTTPEDLKGIRRVRMRIIVPAGFYELNESKSRGKVFLKGKDVLKIIKSI